MKKISFTVLAFLLLAGIVMFSACPDPEPKPDTRVKYDLFLNQPDQGGSFTVAVGSGAATYDDTVAAEGEIIILTAVQTPEEAEDYEFSGFTVTPEQTLAGAGNEWTFFMPAEGVEIDAAFINKNAARYPINVTQPNMGGSFTVAVGVGTPDTENTSAAQGQIITLTATAHTGFNFDGFTVTPAQTLSGEDNTQTFVMPNRAVTVTASFIGTEKRAITVTQPAANGTFTVAVGSAEAVSTNTEAFPNEVITLTAIPAAGFTLESFTITPAATLSGSGNTRTFNMPGEDITITVRFGIVIDDISMDASSYAFTATRAITFAIETTPRRHLWANLEPAGTGSAFGRSATSPLNAVISDDWLKSPNAAVILDAWVRPSPYIYTLVLTAGGTTYSTEIVGVQPETDILHAIPLSQLVSTEGASLASLSGPVTITRWQITCPAPNGLTGTRVYGLSISEVQTRTLTKGSVTGPSGNDFALPTNTTMPVGNTVVVNLTMSAGNQLAELTFAPAQPDIVEGRASAVLAYFIMPNADITVNAIFEAIPEPEFWVIEDFDDASKRGEGGWIGDFCNTTFGYWMRNMTLGWTSATTTGPHWITNDSGNGSQGSNILVVQPANPWFMQIEASTNGMVGRNLPVAMNISQKSTIRILMRRSGSINLEFGLFNGGQALAGYGASSTSTTQTIDETRSGTGYWAAIPDNTTTNSIADSSWDYLDIPLASFTGLDATNVTGYGIRVLGTIGGSLHNRARYYIDNIVALTPEP